MNNSRYFVEDGRLKSVNPWDGKIVDVLRHSNRKPYIYFASVSNRTGEDPPYFFDLPDFVIYEDGVRIFKKMGNNIVDRKENVIALGDRDLGAAYCIVETKIGTTILDDTLSALGVDLNCLYSVEKIKLEKILGYYGRYFPILQTDHGIFADQLFFDNSLKEIICSPMLNKTDFVIFPVFALGKEYSLTKEEEKKLTCQRVTGKFIYSLIEFCKQNDSKILVQRWNTLQMDCIYRELVFTGIEPKAELLDAVFSSSPNGYITFVVVDR